MFLLLFSFSLAHSYKFLVFCCAGVAVIFHPHHLLLYPGMARTRGGHSFRPRVRPSSPPHAPEQSSPPTATNVVPPAPIPAAPVPHRFYTRRARARDLGESSSLSSQEPQPSHIQGPVDDLPPDLSLASIIQCPLFHCGPIAGNSDCSTKKVHYEIYYDVPTFAADPELRDSMTRAQRYSLEDFMTPRQFFYPRVVIEFFHTMTSKRVPRPTIIHFLIDGREGTL